ncbi:MAG TPA: sigma-70 family RNA polymerase sigma factor [Aggregatilineaceae bacterium]|nr:sigma-70 family RNA polymerase sigma factor [Aggregatilineaceae bacterium]
MDEQSAIWRLKRGDIEALAVLVRRYEVQAVRTAYLITHDRALAEDVVQNTFLRIYQRIDQFDEGRPFAPWFMRSVVNAAVQAAHRQRDLSLDASAPAAASGITFADLLPDPAPGPDAEVERLELREAVWEALGQLSPDQRAAVVLRYFLDLSDEEMSGELDCAPGTVRWRLHAARKQLRVLLRRFGRAWQESL